MRPSILVAFPLLLLVTACRQKEAPSAILERLEAARAGDLSTASATSIQQWLQQHEELAVEIKKACDHVEKSGTLSANWGDTTEGRVCAAAVNTSFYHPLKGDSKAR